MALDAQSNWNVQMSQPLQVASTSSSKPAETPAVPQLIYKPNAREILLPVEIIQQIIIYVPHLPTSQKTLWASCLVSRSWYAATIDRLYERPYLGGHNFQTFVTTVCPSKNAHIRRSQLAELVRRLDMGELVHDGSKSLTARLLGRLKGTLTDFVAPQASFSINSFAALSKCTRLRHLDLSLMSAAISIKELFRTLQALINLETLFFPRTSSHDQERDKDPYDWPPKLKALHLAGGINDFFLRVHVTNIPQSLERLSIQHCPMVYKEALLETLALIGPQLRHLTIRHPMNRLPVGALDDTLSFCTNLTALRISADYISNLFFDSNEITLNHPLQILDLDCSESASCDVGIDPDHIWVAIDNGNLSSLRSIRVSARLAWQATSALRRSVGDLTELMEQLETLNPLGIEPGVWSIIS